MDSNGFIKKLKNSHFLLVYNLFNDFLISDFIYYVFKIIEFFQIFSLIINDLFLQMWKGNKFYKKVTDFLNCFLIINFTENNENLFMFFFFFSCFLIFITFLLYFIMLFIEYKGNNIKNYKICKLSFIYLIFLFNTIIYIPVLKILFTLIFCDNEKYFKNKFDCWDSSHYLYLSIAIINFLILLNLFYFYNVYSFERNEAFIDNIIKHIKLNYRYSYINFLTINVILLQLSFVKNIENLVIIFNLIFSIIIIFYIYEEYIFNLNKTIKFLINLIAITIYFICSFLLFIGYLLKQKLFNGLFYLFLILLLLIIFYFLNLKNNLLIDNFVHSNYFNEMQFFQQINLLIHTIEKQELKRNNLFNIFSYFSSNNFSFKFDSNLISDNPSISNEDIIYYTLQFIDLLFKKSLKIFRNSVLLNVSYALFQNEKLKKYNIAYINLELILNNYNLELGQEFYIYRLKKKMEEKGIENENDKTNISFKYHSNLIINYFNDLMLFYNYFWDLVINSSGLENIIKLDIYGHKINYFIEKIFKEYHILKNKKNCPIKISILYGYFLRDILNDTKNSIQYLSLEKEEEEENIFDSNILNINNLYPKSKFQYIVVSGKKIILGVIIKISLELCNYLGYTEYQLIGKNIDILIPDHIKKVHSKMLNKKIEENKKFDFEDKNVKTIKMLLKTSSKCIYPINMNISYLCDENYNKLIFCAVDFENVFNFELNFLILTNKKFNILYHSANSINLLNLDLKTDIFYYIKEISDELSQIYLHRSSKNSLNYKRIKKKTSIHYEQEEQNKYKNKLNIIQNLFFKENNITWKNGIKLKLTVKETKIMNIILGYEFYFEKNNLSSNQLSLINNNSSIKFYQKKISSLSINSKNETLIKSNNFPTINNNFLPNLNDEINFDIKEKTFFLKNYNLKGEKIESIENYFNKNILENLKKNENENIEENEEKSEEEEENDSFSQNNESIYSSSNVSIEKKNYNIKINESVKENLENDEYYHVNLKKIKLYIYDYKNNIINQIYNLDEISKVEEIKIDKENKYNYFNNIKNTNKSIKDVNSINNKNNLLEKNNVNFQNNNKIKIDSLKEKIIHKKVVPKFVNTSLIIYILLYFIILIFMYVFSYVFFNKVFSENSNIQKINLFMIYEISLFRNVLQSFYYVFELIILQNEKYTNFYQNSNKTKYIEYCITKLNDIYSDSMKNLKSFSFESVSLSKETENLLSNIDINVNGFLVLSNYSVYNYIYQSKLTDSLSEFFYCLFTLITNQNNDISALNVEIIYIIFNIDNNMEGLDKYFLIYYKEMNHQINNVIEIIIIYFFICLVVEISMIILGYNANVFIFKEKENNLKLFFKINEEQIKKILEKSKKFSKLEKSKNIISDPKINLEDEDNLSFDESKSLIKIIDINLSYKYNHKKKHNSKHNHKITDNPDIKINFIFTFVFYFILLIFLLYSTIYFSVKIKKIYYYEIINYCASLIEKECLNLVNYIRVYLLYYNIFLYNEYLKNFIIKKTNITGNFYIDLDLYYKYLTHNITKYGLPNSDLNDFLKSVDDLSFCNYINNNQIEFNTICDNLANNITNYGLHSIISYYIDTAYYLLILFEKKVLLSLNSNYTFNELLYGTKKYEKLIPSNEKEKEIYNNLNPFYLFNKNELKDLSVIIFHVLGNLFIDFNDYYSKSLSDCFHNIKKIIKLMNYLFFIILAIAYIIYIIPYGFIKNIDINNSRKILNIIPKDILFEITKKNKNNNN